MNCCNDFATIVANGLLFYAILPLLVSTVCLCSKPIMGITTAIFLLRQVCTCITYKPIIEAIAQIIFLPHHSNKILKLVQECPTKVKNYSFTWVDPKNIHISTLIDCIVEYIIDVLNNYNDDMQHFWKIKEKILEPYAKEYITENEYINMKKGGDINEIKNLKEKYRGKLLEKLGKNIVEIKNEHLNLSHAFGISIGTVKTLRSDFVPLSILSYCEENLKLIKDNKFPPENYKANPLNTNLFILFTVKNT